MPSINPKDAIGSTKLPLHLWPAEATAVGCLGMYEGECKYGRNNYLSGDGVILTTYLAACKRHIDAILSGEDLSPDVLNIHFGNALSSLAIPIKALAHGKLIDDRDYNPNGVPKHLTVTWPTTGYRALVEFLTPWVKKIKDQFKDKNPKHWTIADNPDTEVKIKWLDTRTDGGGGGGGGYDANYDPSIGFGFGSESFGSSSCHEEPGSHGGNGGPDEGLPK